MEEIEKRNIAIIAHVDHGKTTLVDEMLKQTGVFRSNQEVAERVLDSNDQERERGITIVAKNFSIMYKGLKLNIIDTPGHSDFGGEVERILKMAEGVLLLVDAYEGPMPQTRYVLQKALDFNLKPIVVINKIDRPDSRPGDVLEEIFDLFVDLNANDNQLDFPVIYASARNGYAKLEIEEENDDLIPLFDAIVKYIPAPSVSLEKPFQMLVHTLDYSEYEGKIAIGKIVNGTIPSNSAVTWFSRSGEKSNERVRDIYSFVGLGRKKVESASAGDIVAITGIENIEIGDTLASMDDPKPLPIIDIDEPTLTMIFSVNDSPFAGLEGKFVTSRNLRERLNRELRSNVSLKVHDTSSSESFHVSGRGLLHLSVLIENMRREGYELQVSKPKVIFKEINGKKAEPIEIVVIDVPKEFEGQVISLLGSRKGEMLNMREVNARTHFEFKMPSRGLVGLRLRLLSSTQGTAIMYHNFHEYEYFKGDILHRAQGVLVSMSQGDTTAYALDSLRERGVMFYKPGCKVYEGMIIGEHCEQNDIAVNVCRAKKATNMRSATADKGIKLAPPRELTLEMALEYIEDDELIEITPKTFRLRKKLLKENDRKRQKTTRGISI
ncbi:MAG: translational GTPase TypA [Candidatus Scalindua sp. AMX11]|nr:MAG: translational GTPase TypA [Candidatus Scalindua sp.]NOG83611.1 translational GTPase TypA [Planctomycetota bacterium]RZV69637.1 MAG: translational GTPase TypA [Candidatus Scalindua sp. SCAELEC01]TDE64098.1 MAG: translational GTPase TypA [Candidatus Scalindua sp. AMX11]GJQ60156.1 MAG: GTP-binding protein [Candidatus Scalindua sp.]